MNRSSQWVAHVSQTCNIEPAESLLQGEISVQTDPWGLGGGSAIAKLYIPLSTLQCWQKLTNYPQWVNYFPDITHSEKLPHTQQLYQKGVKDFILFRTEVEIYLDIRENPYETVEFEFVKGSFSEFLAYLHLQEYHQGTLMTYAVQAALKFPLPPPLIQQALKIELPVNLRCMRKVFLQKNQ